MSRRCRKSNHKSSIILFRRQFIVKCEVKKNSQNHKTFKNEMRCRSQSALIKCLCLLVEQTQGRKAKSNVAYSFQIIEIEHIIPDEWISFLPNAASSPHIFNMNITIIIIKHDGNFLSIFELGSVNMNMRSNQQMQKEAMDNTQNVRPVWPYFKSFDGCVHCCLNEKSSLCSRRFCFVYYI